MHRFDYRFLIRRMPENMLETAGIIYDLRGRCEVRKENNGAMFRELQRVAMVDSVQSSNAIEGIVTTAERARELIYQRTEPFTHEEQEILGYRDALDEIYHSSGEMEMTEELIRHFHRLMLQSTARDAGQYKRQNNWIQERDEAGRITVRFVPVPAKETQEAMEQMILAYREAKNENGMNGLLLTACLVVDFLCIHPFRDGNGRVSRLLTSLLLLQEGFDVGRYISVDRKINQYRFQYYQALKACSDGWHENQNTYVPFVTFMMQILYSCYKELDEKFIEDSVRKHSKSKRIENAMMQCFVPISKAELAGRFPEISITTIERVLGKMVKEGKIEKIGTSRDARYRNLPEKDREAEEG